MIAAVAAIRLSNWRRGVCAVCASMSSGKACVGSLTWNGEERHPRWLPVGGESYVDPEGSCVPPCGRGWGSQTPAASAVSPVSSVKTPACWRGSTCSLRNAPRDRGAAALHRRAVRLGAPAGRRRARDRCRSPARRRRWPPCRRGARSRPAVRWPSTPTPGLDRQGQDFAGSAWKPS